MKADKIIPKNAGSIKSSRTHPLKEFCMEVASKFITPGIIFLFTLIFGVWLSKIGKPLNAVIFTVHKLIALAAVIFTGIAIYGVIKNVEVHFLIILMMVVIGLCILALFATGTMLSLDLPAQNIPLTIHRLTPALAVVCMAMTIYLISGGKP